MERFHWVEKVKIWFAIVRAVTSFVFFIQFFRVFVMMCKARQESPDADLCLARAGVNHPITQTALTDETQVDRVGLKFFIHIIVGMFVQVANTAQSLYCLCAPRSHGAAAVKTTAWVFIKNFVYVVMAIEARYSHSGKVCSGDYSYYELSSAE